MKPARTKIVATVGPACSAPPALEQLVKSGVDVFRLNLAHGTLAEKVEIIKSIREIGARMGPLGIFVDLAGPKIRLGELADEPIECALGARMRFIRGQRSSGADELTSSYESLVDELDHGDHVLLADGTVKLEVVDKDADCVTCEVRQAGELRSRQGINLPGVKLSLPSLTPQDHKCIQWAVEQDIDFVSLSFVRSADDVRLLKQRLEQLNRPLPVIAKIEKPEALDRLEAIVDEAQAVMVARGDLGVEIDVAEVPIAQKRIIEICNRRLRPVIVATQMLDSMQRASIPTRAEASDVANAILDGADACMLSGETAIGKYPVESVETMNRIMLATEPLLKHRPQKTEPDLEFLRTHPTTSAVVYGAGRIAERLGASLVVIATRSGATALAKSSQRDFVPTIGISRSSAVLNQMSLLWGVTPLQGVPFGDDIATCDYVTRWGRDNGTLERGDRVVIVSGAGIHQGAHNTITVHEVE